MNAGQSQLQQGMCAECGVTGALQDVQRHFLIEHTEETLETSTTVPAVPSSVDETDVITTKKTTDEEPIWTKTRPTPEDVEATDLFLDLRAELASKFDDRKTNKIQCWTDIARQMRDRGYNLGPTPITKLKQKFANLQKTYYNHIRHIKKTGEEKKEPPPFYDKMDELLGHKDKYKPRDLQDSLVPVAACSKDDTAVATTSTSDSEAGEEIKNRFKTKNPRPPSINTQMKKLLEQQHKQDREDRERHFDKFQQIMEHQNHQRDRLLDILQQLADKDKK